MKSILLSLLVISITAFSLVACGDHQTEQYSYNLTENGCSTGDKTASSKSEYCETLADDAKNINDKGYVCAIGLREQRLKEECPNYKRHH